jgi:hypothetical protein
MKKFTEVNIRTPEGKRFIEQQLGDFPVLQKEFPLFIKMLENGTETAGELTSPVRIYSFVSGASIDKIEYTATEKTGADGTTATEIATYGEVYLTEKSPVALISMTIKLNGEPIGYYSQQLDNIMYRKIYCTGSFDGSLKPTDQISALLCCYYNTADGKSVNGGYIDETINSSTDFSVKQVICKAPVKTIKTTPDMITVAYNRGNIGDFDYRLTEMLDKDKNRYAALPVNGEVVLNDGYTYLGVNRSSLGMGSIVRGVIGYNGIPPVFTATDTGFTWSFSNADKNYNWNIAIPDSVRFGNRAYKFNLAINFKVKNAAGQEIDQEVFVASPDDGVPNDKSKRQSAVDSPGTLYILPVKLNWGCVSKYETVLLSSGEEKSVCDIKAGDIIKTPDGTAAVTLAVPGNEEQIAKIKAGGKTIRVTFDHPLLTDNGFFDPKNLKAGDKLVSADGGLLSIENIESEDYNDLVYSIELENGEQFFCSGFVSGTIEVQNRALVTKPTVEASPEVVAEFAKIAVYLENKHNGNT